MFGIHRAERKCKFF